jgi:hypothetical protein
LEGNSGAIAADVNVARKPCERRPAAFLPFPGQQTTATATAARQQWRPLVSAMLPAPAPIRLVSGSFVPLQEKERAPLRTRPHNPDAI